MDGFKIYVPTRPEEGYGLTTNVVFTSGTLLKVSLIEEEVALFPLKIL